MSTSVQLPAVPPPPPTAAIPRVPALPAPGGRPKEGPACCTKSPVGSRVRVLRCALLLRNMLPPDMADCRTAAQEQEQPAAQVS